MKVLIVGNGAREHAIAWKFAQSTRHSGIYCAPGNGGTAEFAHNLINISQDDGKAICAAVQDLAINLVFIGPEAPLSAGLADDIRAMGVLCVGPGADGARLESSKAFSKEFMLRHGIPTANAKIFKEEHKAIEYLKNAEYPLVVKKSGLAAGKGVLETASPSDAMAFATEQLRSGEIVVEEYLSGYEVSLFALCDGMNYVLLPEAADYKKAGENNSGPNTGGMGVVCPVPWFDRNLEDRICREIVEPSILGLKKDGIDYRGILYIGLMMCDDGPKVLEYNVRFGDPEAQALVPLIENDFCNLFEAIAAGNLNEIEIRVSGRQSLCVVVAAEGYPEHYERGREVDLSRVPEKENRFLFHAATERIDGKLLTGGGRCFSAVGTGSELLKARYRAYELASAVRFDGAWFRKDIGNRIFGAADIS